MRLNFESWAALVAFVITIVFVVWPVPYLMVLFTFVAVPLFAIVALFYVARVLGELRKKDVL
jgi:hypothetical protein